MIFADCGYPGEFEGLDKTADYYWPKNHQTITPIIISRGIAINVWIVISSKKAGHKLGLNLTLKNFEKNPELPTGIISGCKVSGISTISGTVFLTDFFLGFLGLLFLAFLTIIYLYFR